MKKDLVRLLILTHNILVCALQEHFQLEANLYKLDCIENYTVFSIPAVKNNNVVNRGRPAGGLSMIYHQSLGKYATPIKVPGSNWVQGLKLNIPGSPFLLINAYLPNEMRTVDFNDRDLLQTLVRHKVPCELS